MTDRYFALTVVLEREIRDDDAAPIIEAIKMIRGVASVKPHVANPETYVAMERARLEFRRKIIEVVREQNE